MTAGNEHASPCPPHARFNPCPASRPAGLRSLHGRLRRDLERNPLSSSARRLAIRPSETPPSGQSGDCIGHATIHKSRRARGRPSPSCCADLGSERGCFQANATGPDIECSGAGSRGFAEHSGAGTESGSLTPGVDVPHRPPNPVRGVVTQKRPCQDTPACPGDHQGETGRRSAALAVDGEASDSL